VILVIKKSLTGEIEKVVGNIKQKEEEYKKIGCNFWQELISFGGCGR